MIENIQENGSDLVGITQFACMQLHNKALLVCDGYCISYVFNLNLVTLALNLII